MADQTIEELQARIYALEKKLEDLLMAEKEAKECKDYLCVPPILTDGPY